MAGTTVRDDGVVLDAFRSAISGRGLSAAEYDQAMKDVQATMAVQDEVFRRLLVTRDLPQTRRSRSTTRPRRSGAVEALPGVDVLATLRAAGIRVCLLTGFSPVTRDAVLAALDWRPLIDLALSPADAGRGRPGPTCRSPRCCGWAAARSLSGHVGDTLSDIESGLRAGAGMWPAC